MTEYPTERQLRTIRNWTGTYRELWDYVVELWHWPDWGVKIETSQDEDGVEVYKCELNTGGWSGNESVIAALEKSKSLFFPFFHTKWERGGHYYFEVRNEMWDVNLTQKPVTL